MPTDYARPRRARDRRRDGSSVAVIYSSSRSSGRLCSKPEDLISGNTMPEGAALGSSRPSRGSWRDLCRRDLGLGKVSLVEGNNKFDLYKVSLLLVSIMKFFY